MNTVVNLKDWRARTVSRKRPKYLRTLGFRRRRRWTRPFTCSVWALEVRARAANDRFFLTGGGPWGRP